MSGTCKQCGQEFRITNSIHIFCSQKCQTKFWRDANPESAIKRTKNYRMRNPIKMKLTRVKARALKKNIDFNISEEDIKYPNTCPVLGIPIDLSKSNNQWNNPSLDRIDNNKGYLKGNVRVISKRANTLKSDATVEELELILADAKRIQNECTR